MSDKQREEQEWYDDLVAAYSTKNIDDIHERKHVLHVKKKAIETVYAMILRSSYYSPFAYNTDDMKYLDLELGVIETEFRKRKIRAALQ
jgi:hypothetical protein